MAKHWSANNGRPKLTYGTLPDLIGKPGPSPLLYCTSCDVEYSASKGDYFMRDRAERPRCCDCNRLLKLVVKVRSYRLWKEFQQ